MACGVFARDFLMRVLNKAGFNFESEKEVILKDGSRCIFDLLDETEKIVVEVCGRDLYNRFSDKQATALENRRRIAREKKYSFFECYYTNKSLSFIGKRVVEVLSDGERPKYFLIVNGD